MRKKPDKALLTPKALVTQSHVIQIWNQHINGVGGINIASKNHFFHLYLKYLFVETLVCGEFWQSCYSISPVSCNVNALLAFYQCCLLQPVFSGSNYEIWIMKEFCIF